MKEKRNCKKKKIVQFIHGLNMGGAETLVKDYVLGFDKEKYDVSVLCYEHCDSPYEAILRDAGIKVVSVCDDMKHLGFETAPALTFLSPFHTDTEAVSCTFTSDLIAPTVIGFFVVEGT